MNPTGDDVVRWLHDAMQHTFLEHVYEGRPVDTHRSVGWMHVEGKGNTMECLRCGTQVEATLAAAMEHHRKHWPHAGTLISDCEDRVISRD